MTDKRLIERYQIEAAAAERLANGFPDGYLKDIWRDIAQGYRGLVRSMLNESSIDAALERPSTQPEAPASEESEA